MKKILIFSALLIVTLSSYSQISPLNLVPLETLNNKSKYWCFDSTQIRVIATKLNDLYYCDSLVTLKNEELSLLTKRLVIDSLIIDKKDTIIASKDREIILHEDQLDYQYTREIKRHIGWGGIITLLLLGLLINK